MENELTEVFIVAVAFVYCLFNRCANPVNVRLLPGFDVFPANPLCHVSVIGHRMSVIGRWGRGLGFFNHTILKARSVLFCVV